VPARAGITIPIVPGVMPTTNFSGVARMAAKARRLHSGLAGKAYQGWMPMWRPAALSLPPCYRIRWNSFAAAASDSFYFYNPQPAKPDLCGLPYSRKSAQGFGHECRDRQCRIAWDESRGAEAACCCWGRTVSWGVMKSRVSVQAGRRREVFGGSRFIGNHPSEEAEGNNDLLDPEPSRRSFKISAANIWEAGVDFIETTPSIPISTSQEDYGLGHLGVS